MFKNTITQHILVSTHCVPGMVMRKMITRASSLHLQTQNFRKDVNKTNTSKRYMYVYRVLVRAVS